MYNMQDVLDAMPQPQDEKVLSIKKKSSEVRCGQFRYPYSFSSHKLRMQLQ